MEAKEIAEKVVLYQEKIRQTIDEDSHILKIAKAYLSLLAAQENKVLVPVEPVQKMLIAGCKEYGKSDHDSWQIVYKIYKAMTTIKEE